MSSHEPSGPNPDQAAVNLPPVTTGQSQPSRRAFLAGTAGALALTALGAKALAGVQPAPAAITPRPPAPAAMPKCAPRTPVNAGQAIKMAVIGTGGMGTNHCSSFIALHKAGKEQLEIVALADVNQRNLAKAKGVCETGQGNTVETFTDYRKLLARQDINGVLIASPEHWHAQMAIDALVAGKDVYLEKPMTLKLDEALRVRELVKANPDLRLQVGTQMTNMPKFHRAREVIAAGTIGTPVWSQTSYCRNSKDGEWNYYLLDPDLKPGVNLDWEGWCGPGGAAPWDPKVYARWRRYRHWSTGIIGDLLVHVVTPMLVAIGEKVGWPTRVTASGLHCVDKAMENHDQVNITVEFEHDHTMIIAGSTCNETGLETRIRGNKGNIDLNSRHCIVRPERIYAEELDEKRIDCPDIGNDQDVHRVKWLKCVRDREMPDSDVDQGSKVMVIVDLATRSMWDGGAYTFNPKTMTAARQ